MSGPLLFSSTSHSIIFTPSRNSKGAVMLPVVPVNPEFGHAELSWKSICIYRFYLLINILRRSNTGHPILTDLSHIYVAVFRYTKMHNYFFPSCACRCTS